MLYIHLPKSIELKIMRQNKERVSYKEHATYLNFDNYTTGVRTQYSKYLYNY